MSITDLAIPAPDDEARKVRFQEEAARLHQELIGKEGLKALLVIVDDEKRKAESTQQQLQDVVDYKRLGFILAVQYSGQDGVDLYEAFRQSEDPEQQTPVVLIMDGALGRDQGIKYNAGIRVVYDIIKRSRKQGWQLPLVVGNSSDTYTNNEFGEWFPEQYLGGWNMSPLETIDGIAARLA